MEAHGVPGKIQVSAATHDLLNGEFVCEPRGLVDIKGMGEMETWFLGGRPLTPVARAADWGPVGVIPDVTARSVRA